MKSSLFLSSAAAAIAVLSAGTASAQDALDRADPLIVEAETTERDDPDPPSGEAIATPAAAPVAASANEAVQVGAVRLLGLETLSQADFMPVIEPVLGTTLDTTGQRDLVRSIAAQIHALGYPLGNAVIEPQSLSAGVLTIRVDEGRIDAVRIEGDENALVDRMFAPLVTGRPVRGNALERAILLAEVVPGVRVVRAQLEQQGALNVLVVRLRETTTEGRFELDNWGSDTIGPLKLRGRVEHRGALTNGDEVRLYAVTTPADPAEYVYASLGYSVPVDANGTRVGFSGSVARIDAIGANTGRNLEGEGERAKLWVEHPVVLTPDATMGAAVGFSFRDTRQFADGDLSRDERVAALTARLNGSFQLDDTRSFGRIELTHGTGWFGATREGDAEASRDDGDARFTLIELSGSVITPVTGPLSLRTDAKAQFASRPLLAGDELGFGGPNFGRGYYFREESGDNAVAGAVELRVDGPRVGSLLEGFQVYGYGDAARLWNLRGGETHDLATAGAGLRARVTRRFGFGVELGVPIDKDRDPRGNLETWFRF